MSINCAFSAVLSYLGASAVNSCFTAKAQSYAEHRREVRFGLRGEAMLLQVAMQEFFEETFVGKGGDVIGGTKFVEYW